MHAELTLLGNSEKSEEDEKHTVLLSLQPTILQPTKGPKSPSGETTDDMDIVSGNATTDARSQPLIPVGVTLASLSPILYQHVDKVRQTTNDYLNRLLVLPRTLGFKFAELQTSGQHDGVKVTKTTTTVTPIWTSPIYRRRTRLPDLQTLPDLQINITRQIGDKRKQIMLHAMDGTTTTTITPNTQPGRVHAT